MNEYQEDEQMFDELMRQGKWIIMGVIILLTIIVLVTVSHADTYTHDQLADAIYHAEGGAKAKKPYGILSVKCDGEQECRRVCINTIRNNERRYKEYGYKDYPDYISFLASQGCIGTA